MQEKIDGFVEDFFEFKQADYAWSCPTGVASLDVALGGALPWGITEVYGDAGVGKTALLYEILSSAQTSGLTSVLVASEYLDLSYAEAIGVCLDQLVIISGGPGEWALSAIADLVRKGPCAVVIDTATSFRPEGDDDPMAWSLMWAANLRKIALNMQPSSCVVVANQVRQSVSVEPHRRFTGKLHSTGRRLADVFSTRLELSRSEVSPQGYELQINILCSPYTMPGRAVTVPATLGLGVNTLRDLVRCAAQRGVVRLEGSWYYYDDTQLGQGEAAAARFLEDHVSTVSAILADVLSRARVR